jgi:MutS domain V
MLSHLNESSVFLQLLSVGNMLSPVISLLVPILFLIIPFFILKFKGIPITMDVYVQILQDIAKHHFIGKAIAGVQSMSIDKMVSVVIMFGLYLMQIYQNIVICWRFYENTKGLNKRLLELRSYVRYSIVSMRTFLELHSDKASYTSFCEDVQRRLAVLADIHQWLVHVSEFQFGLRKGAELGYMLRINYELWKNQEYQDALRYSVGFEGFMDNLRGVHRHFTDGYIAFADVCDAAAATPDEDANTDKEEDTDEETNTKSSKMVFQDQYYPVLLSNNDQKNGIVKNRLDMQRNMIITGPNASGKTTYLKTTALNLIFSQQLGVGFYSSGKLPKLYTHIHSYLNIPDTSERDSLFQAEARRCKDILDAVASTDTETSHHFCIFDELYSGTNPKEATKAAYAFLKYLSEKSNTDFVLTTHYVEMCKQFRKSKRVANYQMLVDMLDGGRMKYTYRIDTGISKVEGAIRILEDMNYPSEIMLTLSGRS